MPSKKELGRLKRHGRIRRKIWGTAERPRVSVHRSLNHIYVQVVDDTKSSTLFSISTLAKDFQKAAPKSGKAKKSTTLGELVGAKLKEKGIKKISFDRGGYKYHGRVKALADGLRQAAIEF